MSDLRQRVEATLRRHRLWADGKRVLVAVSGGVDSLVLLQVLHGLAGRHRWQLVVAHCNHQLRGRASEADERLVKRTAEQLGLTCVTERVAVKEFAVQNGVSIEMAARTLRHDYLACAAREQRCGVIALAHHADDQVELFFLRLLRGAGGEGLAGMKRISPSPADRRVKLVRPLLDCTKEELRAWAREQKLRFREDASNALPDPLRNRLRLELLPLLKQDYQPGLAATVRRTMEIAGAEAEFAQQTAREWRLRSSPKPGWTDLPVAVQRHVVQLALREVSWVPDFELVEQLRARPGRRVSAGAGTWAVLEPDGGVKIITREAESAPIPTQTVSLEKNSGSVQHGETEIRWTRRPQGRFTRPRPSAGREVFDADRVGAAIELRTWRPGDRFQPIGLAQATKVQDLFVNAKVPRAERGRRMVAVASDGGIFWVEGLRIGERYKLTRETRRQLVLKFNKPASCPTPL